MPDLGIGQSYDSRTGSRFTNTAVHRFRNEDGMLARWYLLLGQFSVTFEYRPGAQHADGMSRQCGQCQRPDFPVSSSDSLVADLDTTSALVEQSFASSKMGESMEADLYCNAPRLSVRPSVRPSITFSFCTVTQKRID